MHSSTTIVIRGPSPRLTFLGAGETVVGGVAGAGDGGEEVVAGHVREAAEVGGILEAVAAGGEVFVAAGGDDEGVADERWIGERLPEFEAGNIRGESVALDLDGAVLIGAARETAEPAGEPIGGVG